MTWIYILLNDDIMTYVIWTDDGVTDMTLSVFNDRFSAT